MTEINMMKKISTSTLGCKVNYADTHAIAALLPAAGSRAMEIVGTCCVTAEGEKQSRKEARRASRRVGSEGVVIVTGCAARMKPLEFEGLGENIRVVTGQPRRVAETVSGMIEPGDDALSVSGGRPRRTRLFLKVQDGCANMCSYCVVPLVRGRPVSIPGDDLLALAREQVRLGYPEIVVSGINVGAYDDGSRDLAGLMEELAAVEGLSRLRLSSIEPLHISSALIEVFRRHENIARHLHVPLQSGDDRVLADMNRRYDRAGFAARVSMLRDGIEDMNLSTDVIVGFPSEDRQAFRATMDFVRDTVFTKVHVFTYSQRPGTAAAAREDSVGARDKKERSRELRELSDGLQRIHRERKVGQLSEVLLESSPRGDSLSGYSRDYTRFVVNGGQPGRLAMVLGEAVTDDGVQGKVMDYE